VTDRANEKFALRKYARTNANSLQLKQGLGFDVWSEVGHRIARVSNASCWWLGDWLVYGERAYGRRYADAIEASALDYQTLRNYAWVARRFEPSRRRAGLSLQHHAEVAALPAAEQDLWLDRCQRRGWSRNEFRRRIKAIGPTESELRAPHAHTVRVPVTTDREQLWREAAAAADQELVDWIAGAADQAARAALHVAAA
jgi:hypothetical protein